MTARCEAAYDDRCSYDGCDNTAALLAHDPKTGGVNLCDDCADAAGIA